MGRDLVAGPENGPEPPFPIKLSGKIIKGFGRGSKELGIPTANIPITGLDVGGHTDLESGVFYGFAGLSMATASSNRADAAEPPSSKNEGSQTQHDLGHAVGAVVDGLLGRSKDPYAATEKRPTKGGGKAAVYPMVMSIGWNPFYKNEVRSVEVHLIHQFESDFYNALMNLEILGFIRHEQDYDSLESLIADIKTDIDVTGRSLARPAYATHAKDASLNDFSWAETTTEGN